MTEHHTNQPTTTKTAHIHRTTVEPASTTTTATPILTSPSTPINSTFKSNGYRPLTDEPSERDHTTDAHSPSPIATALHPPPRVSLRDTDVVFVGIALLLAFIFNNVAWIYLSDRAGEMYGFFLDQMTTLMLVLMQIPIFAYQYFVSRTIPTEEVTALPWKVLLIMGSVDAIYDCFVTMGSPYTPGPTQTILFQLPIPITMFIAYFIQKKRFPNGQYLGGFIILSGCILTIAPGLARLLQNKDPSGSDSGAPIKAASVLFYGLGVLFYSGNTVYKEVSLKSTKINIWYLSIVDSSINFVMTFILIPLLWLPGLGVDTPNSTFPHFWAGIKCFFLETSDMDPSAECEGLWWLTLINVFANVMVNVLTLLLIRKGSAVILQVVSGVQVPLCNLFYACPFVMTTKYVAPMDRYMWSGLGVVSVGLYIYSFLPLGSKPPQPIMDEVTVQTIQTNQTDAGLSPMDTIHLSTGTSLHEPLIHPTLMLESEKVTEGE